MKKIIFLIFVIFVTTLSFYAYPVVKDRYIDKNDATSEEEKTEIFNKKTMEIKPSEEKYIEESEVKKEEVSSHLKITHKDCSNKCERFENAKDFEYCNQYCSISIPEPQSEECSDKKGLEKDYCHKNLAIKNIDFKECEKIEDENIKESCTVRVTEKIMEKPSPATENNVEN